MLLIIITGVLQAFGKGPDKQQYLDKLASIRYKRVAFRTMWLEPEDYPRLLGAADVGVCLHTSSSGLDLPMKVVDMLGSGLPVLAHDYVTIQELLQPNITGLLFQNAQELGTHLVEVLRGFPEHPSTQLQRLGKGAAGMMGERWQDGWREVVAPMLAEASSKVKKLE